MGRRRLVRSLFVNLEVQLTDVRSLCSSICQQRPSYCRLGCVFTSSLLFCLRTPDQFSLQLTTTMPSTPVATATKTQELPLQVPVLLSDLTTGSTCVSFFSLSLPPLQLSTSPLTQLLHRSLLGPTPVAASASLRRTTVSTVFVLLSAVSPSTECFLRGLTSSLSSSLPLYLP